MENNIKHLISLVDHTLLSVTATEDDIRELCEDAVRFGTASVCVPPCYVKSAKGYLGNKMPVCTVIGFPNGYSTAPVKFAEAVQAIADGADEIDMVINICDVKNGKYDRVLREISQIKRLCERKILKVIIETCLLTDEEKIRMCEIVTLAGADYIKTSTGFSDGGATPYDIELFSKHIGAKVKIKASGGIKSFEDAERLVSLGASRLGTSKLVAILKNK